MTRAPRRTASWTSSRPTPPAARVDQRGVVPAERVGRVAEVVGGHALQHQRGRHVRRRRHRARGRRGRPAPPPARRRCRARRPTRPVRPTAASSTPSPTATTSPAPSSPRPNGGLHRVGARPLVGVDEVHPRGGDADEHLSGARGRVGDLVEAHDLGTTGFGDTDGAHGRLLRDGSGSGSSTLVVAS